MSYSFDFPYALSGTTGFAVLAVLKVTCVLLAALAATALMRRSSAGARHLVCLMALIAALVLPFWSLWSPVPVRVLPAAERPAVSTTTAAPEVSRATVTAHRASPTSASPIPRRPIGLGMKLLALWTLIAVALLGRLAIGAWSVRRIVHGGRVLAQPDWQRQLMEIADRLGLSDVPRLVQSDRIRMPFATGFLKAVIVLPSESASWSAERRSAVLIHELAHIRRRDLTGHLVSRIACALYWFHPLVWTAARQLRAESERACDDLALVLGARASEYAEHLLDIVKDVRDERMPAVALAMAKPSEFEGRMLAILDPRRRRRGPGRIQAAWLIGTLTTLALVVGALSPARRATATPATSSRSGSNAASTRLANQNDPAEPAIDDSKLAAAPAATKSGKSAQPPEPKEPSAPPNGKDTEATQEANDAQRVQVLAKSLRSDPDAEVRRVAAWGLANHADNEVAVQALVDAVAKEQDVDVREMATWALAESHSPAAAAAIESAFRRDRSAEVRRTAAWAAGSIGSKTSVEGLTALLADTDPGMREVAAWSIGSCEPDHAPPALIRALGDANRDVRLSVAWALYSIGDPSAADALEAAFHREKDPEVQRGLIRALGSMGDQAVATLTRLVESPDKEIRAVAVTALAGGNAGGPWPWPRPEPRPYP